MDRKEFIEVLIKATQVIDIGIKKEYFKIENKDRLHDILLGVIKKGIKYDIQGNAIYGYYSTESNDLHFNPKVLKNEMDALIYSIHEIKHALDDFGDRIGFEDETSHEGVGRNEGATQRFATDMAEEILGEKVEPTIQKSLGISLLTNLDEYQLEDRINELFCKAIGISRADFFRMQNSQDTHEFDEIKRKFNEHASFDTFSKSLDGIYFIQTETWFDEKGNFLEHEKEATPEQTARAMQLINQCQHEIIQYIEMAKPEILKDIQKEFIVAEGNQLVIEAVSLTETSTNITAITQQKNELMENKENIKEDVGEQHH